MPIQIIEGFSMQEHVADFIMLSSSSMTTHMFTLKSDEELAETQSQQKESWTFSQFLPQYYQLERSKIRLDILAELAPPSPYNPKLSKVDGRHSTPAPLVEVEG